MVRSRQRKKKQQRALREQERSVTPEEIVSSRGSGLSEPLLEDPHRINGDLRIASKAVRGRWNIPEDKRNGMIERLYGIVGKKSNIVLTKAGPFDSESDADSNAIAASKVIVTMIAQDQADDHLEVKVNQPTSGTNVNVNVGVGVQVNQVTQPIQRAIESDPDFLEFIERKRLAASGLEGGSDPTPFRDVDQFAVSGTSTPAATLPRGDADDCRCGGRAAVDGDDATAAR